MHGPLNVKVSHSVNYFGSCEMLPGESGNSLPVDFLTRVTIQKLYENFQLLDFEV